MAEATQERTVVFVDLAGFTALTERHGDDQAADLAERFVGLTQNVLGPGDRLIKSIGDAVMIASRTPVEGLESLRRLIIECRETDDFPIPRAGLHHGPVVERGSDVFGATVNMAARIAGQASAGQVLGTTLIASAAQDMEVHAASVGQVQLRNLSSPVELFEIHLTEDDADTYTIDPVCRMRVEPARAAGWLRYEGTGWWFCSLTCAATFAQSPDTYARMND